MLGYVLSPATFLRGTPDNGRKGTKIFLATNNKREEKIRKPVEAKPFSWPDKTIFTAARKSKHAGRFSNQSL